MDLQIQNPATAIQRCAHILYRHRGSLLENPILIAALIESRSLAHDHLALLTNPTTPLDYRFHTFMSRLLRLLAEEVATFYRTLFNPESGVNEETILPDIRSVLMQGVPENNEIELPVANPNQALSRCGVLLRKGLDFCNQGFLTELLVKGVLNQPTYEIMGNPFTSSDYKWNQFYMHLIRLASVLHIKLFLVILGSENYMSTELLVELRRLLAEG